MSAGYERREKQAGGPRKPARAVHGPGYAPTLDDMVAWLRRELAGRCVVELRMVGGAGVRGDHHARAGRGAARVDVRPAGARAAGAGRLVLAKKALVALAERHDNRAPSD